MNETRIQGTISTDQTTPGGSATLTAPGDSFTPASTVPVFLAAAVDDAQAQQLGSSTVDDNGGAQAPFSVPTDTAAGIYYVYMVGSDPSGVQRVVLAPIVVQSASAASASTTSTAPSGFAAASGASPSPPGGGRVLASGGPARFVTPPASIRRLQQPAPVVTAAAAAVQRGATLAIDGDRLVTRSGPLRRRQRHERRRAIHRVICLEKESRNYRVRRSESRVDLRRSERSSTSAVGFAPSSRSETKGNCGTGAEASRSATS